MSISCRVDELRPEVVRVFADPLRLRIIQMLAAEQLCTCHLVEETGARQPTVSHHLKVLRDSGMVDTEPCGSFTYYRLRPEALAAVAEAFGGLASRATTALQTRRPCT